MKLPTKTLLSVVFLLIVASFQLPAADQKAQKPATGKEMDKFIADWPDFTKWYAARGKSIEDAKNPLLVGALTRKDLDSYLAKKGWDTDRFLYLLGVCTSGIMAVNAEQNMPGVAEQFDDAIQQIKDNPDMSDADKQENISNLQSAKDTALGTKNMTSLTKEELDLVRVRMDALLKVMGEAQ